MRSFVLPVTDPYNAQPFREVVTLLRAGWKVVDAKPVDDPDMNAAAGLPPGPAHLITMVDTAPAAGMDAPPLP